jgi:hypothetical protein
MAVSFIKGFELILYTSVNLYVAILFCYIPHDNHAPSSSFVYDLCGE